MSLPIRPSLPVRWGVICLLLFAGVATRAADRTAPAPGLRDNTPTVHALTGARVFVSPGRVLAQATIVVRDGVIVGVGPELEPPPDARLWNFSGKTIYPGLIDAYSEVTSAGTDSNAGDSNSAQTGYWNEYVTPQTTVLEGYRTDDKVNDKLRSQGITARLLAPASGVIKGTSAVVTTGKGTAKESVMIDSVALHLRLTPAARRRDLFPNSPMGAVALVRQAFYDCLWYQRAWETHRTEVGVPRPEINAALVALEPFAAGGQPVVIDAPDELYLLRADRLAREFKLNLIVRGSGHEYRRLEAVAAAGRAVLVPVEFTPPPKVDAPDEAREISLERLMHWDLAPENPARLAQAGVKFALTTDKLKDPGKFLAGVRQAVERGLAAEAALAAATITPAELLGVADRTGTLEAGKLANLVVTDGNLFAKKTKILETWIAGKRYEVTKTPTAEVTGHWQLTLTDAGDKNGALHLELTGESPKLKAKLSRNATELTVDHVELEHVQLVLRFKGKELGWDGIVRMGATLVGDRLHGTGRMADGSAFAWQGTRTEAPARPKPEQDAGKKDEDKSDENKSDIDSDQPKEPRSSIAAVNYPLGAFGIEATPPQPAAVLFTHATVWTSGPQGTLTGASVLIKSGKIAAVGRNLKPPAGTLVIDLEGRHLTPGLIDCHSHSATDGGINESTQTITAEVRIGDFVDSDDVNIYRQLAGGLTTINILHGSANTIGGQNQLIKLRWGELPETLKFAGAPAGVKFALGENVKQSNWGEKYRTRYPQTRMGVEQLVRDAFEAARAYHTEMDSWRPGSGRLPPRKDLELDALAEVLAGTRLIHCHSYRQDEILALMRTCESYGVRIGTLQHILEGYKIADQIARHGAGGSSFSDWWAYKFEVYDAIPYNGSLMHNQGVVVSFNSDSAELARRLNAEAAKAVKYGGLDEAAALKFVTLNPARQLGIDKRVGSIEIGKDADLAVWNTSPLSSYARCEQTWIDGRKYFDRERDQQLRAQAKALRNKLIAAVLTSGETPGDDDTSPDTLWPREDEFCHHHGHGHGHDHE